MLESAIALGISHVMKKERFVERTSAKQPDDKQPAAKQPAPKQPAPKTFAVGFLFIFLNFLFNVWIASIAYKCNGNSVLWGIFGFVAPVIYIIVHAVHSFRCDRFVPSMTGGRRARAFAKRR